MKISGRRLLKIPLLCITILACGKSAGSERPVVVATTTMIGDMLSRLAGERLEVRVLIPPRACPGHFDLSPSDAANLSQAGLIVRHGFQAYLDRKLTAQNPDLRIAVLPGSGQLIVPANYLAALRSLNEILMENYPGQADFFAGNLKTAAQKVSEAEKQAQERIAAAGLAGARVLGSVMQAEFLEWAGLEVCGTFTNSPDELSVLQLKELVETADRRQVEFIAGNLHSGGEEVAKMIAAESGLPACLLSNFPGTNERNPAFGELLLDNIDRLVEARNRADSTGDPGGLRTGISQAPQQSLANTF